MKATLYERGVSFASVETRRGRVLSFKSLRRGRDPARARRAFDEVAKGFKNAEACIRYLAGRQGYFQAVIEKE